MYVGILLGKEVKKIECGKKMEKLIASWFLINVCVYLCGGVYVPHTQTRLYWRHIEEFRQNNECNSWNYNYLLKFREPSDKGSFRKVRFL